MATGRLGASDLSATTNTTVYQCPASNFAVVTLSVCNRTASTITCRVALSTSASPALADYLEYGVSILANGVLERTGIVMAANQYLIVYSSASSVSAVVFGIETAT